MRSSTSIRSLFWILGVILFFHRTDVSHAQPAPVSLNGPQGASILNFSIDPNGAIIAGADALYASSDPGSGWNLHPTSRLHGYVRIAVASPDATRFISTEKDGTLRSLDYGKTWIATGQKAFDAMGFNADGSIAIGHSRDGIFLSTDRGATWSLQQPPGLVQTLVNIVFLTNDIVLASGYSSMLRSTDHGLSWTPHTPMLGSGWARIAVMADGSVVASTPDGFNVSKDEGLTWQSIPTPFSGLTEPAVIAADKQGTLYCGARWSVYRTTDLGQTWMKLPALPRKRVRELLVSPTGSLLAGLEYEGIREFDAVSQKWLLRSEGLTNTSIASLHFDATGVLYAGPDSLGMNLSSDLGQTWEHATTNVYDYAPYQIIGGRTPDEPVFESDGATGVFRSNDHGMSWIRISSDIYNVMFAHANVLVGESRAGLQISKDRGQSWGIVANAPSLDGGVSAGEDGGLFVNHTDTLFYSTDNGSSWQFVISPGYADQFVATASGTVIRVNVDTLYRANPQRTSWQKLDFVSHSFIGLVAIGDILYAINDDGVACSRDQGTSWQLVYSQPGGRRVSAIAERNGMLFLGTYGSGIYRISQAARVGKQESPIQLTLYPNPAVDLVQVTLGADHPQSIELRNAAGDLVQEVRDANLRESVTINVAALPAGSYFVRYQADGVERTGKLVKR